MSRAAALFTFAVLVLSAATASAQQPAEGAPCSYELCAVRFTAGFSGQHLLRGASSEQVVKIGFTGSNAADFLSRVESAAGPAREFERRRKRSTVFAILGGLASGYVALSVFAAQWDEPTSTDYTVLFLGFGSTIMSGLEASRSLNDLSRAIWEFNRAPIR